MKKVLTIILTALIFCISIIPAHAIDDYGVMPCYNNVASQRTGFDISSSGEATVSVTIRGYQGVTTRIVITYEIQKKLIGNIWQDVDGAGWRGENTGNSFSITHSYQLPES
ncbi:MAG: hypothetical protein J6A29_06930, partial [Clostridia bacterium]|nr:hypothetical protein [Clostridia bacterium]